MRKYSIIEVEIEDGSILERRRYGDNFDNIESWLSHFYTYSDYLKVQGVPVTFMLEEDYKQFIKDEATEIEKVIDEEIANGRSSTIFTFSAPITIMIEIEWREE